MNVISPAASLERAALTYWEALIPREDDRPPRARILHIFERLESLSRPPAYRSCPLVATAVELKDSEHPAGVVARRFKDMLTNYFHQEVRRSGVAVTSATTLLDVAGLRQEPVCFLRP
ncbi:hypothetical protein ACFXKC_50970 [Streptomyces sp. NPDC059340]|uniref:hypothetical protein n=1 Tax=Streptomyces sp. NPDC059340 TaxID=3346806 RepID=UPI0036890E96